MSFDDCLLGFRVSAFVPGRGWLYDNFELKQAAIECAMRCIALPDPDGSVTAYVEEVTRTKVDGKWMDEERLKRIWHSEEDAWT